MGGDCATLPDLGKLTIGCMPPLNIYRGEETKRVPSEKEMTELFASHLALGHVLVRCVGAGDVQKDDVPEFFLGGPVGAGCADIACADDGDLCSFGCHLNGVLSV